jgi:hypothetical protein
MSKVRATRAYLASQGSPRSVLALAALLFVIASACVVFNGWAPAGKASMPALVLVSRSSLPSSSLGANTRGAIEVAAVTAGVQEVGGGFAGTVTRTGNEAGLAVDEAGGTVAASVRGTGGHGSSKGRTPTGGSGNAAGGKGTTAGSGKTKAPTPTATPTGGLGGIGH